MDIRLHLTKWSIHDAGSIKLFFRNRRYPRSLRNQKHPLITLIGTTLLASLARIDSFSGFTDFTEAHYEKLSEYFNFPYGCPSHDTYQCLWDEISPSQFYASFTLFTASLSKLTQTFINLDGKMIRHCGDEKALHIVSAWCYANQLVLAQEKVDSKSNEISALPHAEFFNHCPPQQLGGSDCGWWAVYNAIVLAETGNTQFLSQFMTRQRATQLRQMFPQLTITTTPAAAPTSQLTNQKLEEGLVSCSSPSNFGSPTIRLSTNPSLFFGQSFDPDQMQTQIKRNAEEFPLKKAVQNPLESAFRVSDFSDDEYDYSSVDPLDDRDEEGEEDDEEDSTDEQTMGFK